MLLDALGMAKFTSLSVPSAGEDVGQWALAALHALPVGMGSATTTLETSLAVPQKVKHTPTL